MEATIIGTGYVGLVTGACLAEMGHVVTCLDIDEEKIKKLNKSIVSIYEPGLADLIKKNRREKRLYFTTSYKQAIEKSKVCFICVPTPSNDDGSCNTSYIRSAAASVGKYINDYKVIVTKSTCPVGTCFEIKNIIADELKKRKKIIDFDIASNPEFLKEGSAVVDFFKPDRIVIGCENERTANIMQKIYLGFTVKQNRIIFMDILSSEMTKYAANAMLATRISFMNEIAKICKNVGADINKVRKGIGSDSRIGYSFLYAGIGYGGSCFPKDIKALCHLAKQVKVEPHLLRTVDEINNEQKKILALDIMDFFSKNGGLHGKTIAVWGLSFKPDTDDMREAPSLTLIELLLKKGAVLRLYDPVAMQNAKKLLKNEKNIVWCKDELHAAKGSDAIALLTEWKQFRLLDFDPIKKNMKQAVFFDGRNQYHPAEMQKKGFKYIGIGVPDHL